MRKGLSNLANYCRDRGIIVLAAGIDELQNTLYFTVCWPRYDLSLRVRNNFERRIRNDIDNVGYTIDILYKQLGKKDYTVILT